jgi:hypothetical protein
LQGKRSRLPNTRRNARIFIVLVSFPLSQQMFDTVKTDHQPSADRKEDAREPHNCIHGKVAPYPEANQCQRHGYSNPINRVQELLHVGIRIGKVKGGDQ